MEAALGDRDAMSVRLAAMARSIPAGRVGDPLDLALAVLFMASDDASYVKGTELVVDGGRSSTT